MRLKDEEEKKRIRSPFYALVGKGVTFDSGGISIKPAEKMEDMKADMAGGAAVLATMAALAQLRPRHRVIGLIPAVENLPGPEARAMDETIWQELGHSAARRHLEGLLG